MYLKIVNYSKQYKDEKNTHTQKTKIHNPIKNNKNIKKKANKQKNPLKVSIKNKTS